MFDWVIVSPTFFYLVLIVDKQGYKVITNALNACFRRANSTRIVTEYVVKLLKGLCKAFCIGIALEIYNYWVFLKKGLLKTAFPISRQLAARWNTP